MKKIVSTIIIIGFLALLLPLTAAAMEYKHKLDTQKMKFSWSIDDENIHVMISARTTGWVGIGFDPEKAMQGANIIIGAVKNGKVKVEDHYGNRKTGHKKDEDMGGKNHILNPAGSEEDGVTTISFTLPLTSDDKWDKPINATGITRIMLAYGSGKDSFKTRHPYRTIYDIDLSTGKSKKLK